MKGITDGLAAEVKRILLEVGPYRNKGARSRRSSGMARLARGGLQSDLKERKRGAIFE